MIKQIWLDLGKVLVHFQERAEVVGRIVRKFGGDAEGVLKLFGNGKGESVYDGLDNGTVTLEDLWQTVCRKGKLPEGELPLYHFATLYVHHLLPNREVIRFFRNLQSRYDLVVVSNGDYGSRYIVDFLETHYGMRFSKVFLSFEQRIKKPGLLNRVIEWAKEKKALPSSCIFVEDMPDYILAAGNRGIHTLQFDATKQSVEYLETKLAKFGVTS